MEKHKLKMDDLQGFEPARRKEVAEDIRKELAMGRMDIYQRSEAGTKGKARALRKNLARIKTIENQMKNKSK